MIIQSKQIWIDEQFEAKQLEINEGKITNIYPYNQERVDIDYQDQRILAGFIDSHVHGGYGFDTNDADEDGLKNWLRNVVSEGVTSLTPTTITQSKEVLIPALKNVAQVHKESPFGAQIVGIHFEGPYLNVAYKGAQPEQHIVKPNVKEFKEYQEAANGLIKVITMATENDDQFELTKHCDATGVFVNIGHSAATFEEAMDAFKNGAKGTTHTFNRMSPLNHREPNLVGSALYRNDVYGELICDGIHVSLPIMNLFYRSKDVNKAVLITDAVAAKGVGVGRYIFGKQEIEVRENGGAYLAGTNNLAGSTLRYNIGLKNVIEDAKVDLVKAINSTSLNPAAVLGISDHKGLIKKDYDADLVVLDDEYNVVETYVLGKSVYRA